MPNQEPAGCTARRVRRVCRPSTLLLRLSSGVTMNVAGPGNGGTAPSMSKPGPNAPANAESGLQRKRTNPLGELIATEVRYVNEMGLAIRRVAAAWNPNNFPPGEVDTMFRSLEVVLRTNTEFLRSLQEIGPNPASPKGLGNLLMHWVDKLQPPYSQYLTTFVPNLNALPAVQSNTELAAILAQLSREMPRSAAEPSWTLDDFFELPLARLRFYKKLYNRLLRNTQPGRSDHVLLANANKKLDMLVERAQQCKDSSAQGPVPSARPVPAPALSFGGSGAPPPRAPMPPGPAPVPISAPMSTPTPAMGPSVRGTPGRPPVRSSGPSMIPVSITQSIERQSLAQIQDRIDSTATVDVFTLEPKHCRLQMAPPTLPFQRQLRINDSARLQFTSSSKERVYERARLILLTDLLLVGEDVEPHAMPPPSHDIRLTFPPLSGRFIDMDDQSSPNPCEIRLSIMKRVDLIITLPSPERKAQWIRELQACKHFGAQSRSPQRPRASIEMNRAAGPPGAASPRPLVGVPQSPQEPPRPPMMVSSSPPGAFPISPSGAPIRPPAPGPAGAGPVRAPAPVPLSGPTPRAARPPVRPSPMPAQPPSSSLPLQKLMQPLPLGPPTSGPSPAAGAPPAVGAPLPPFGPGSAAPSSPVLAQGRTALPPLLLPKSATNETLPLVPLAEQDAGRVGSPVSTEALTRASSLTSQESFPRIVGRRVDSPDLVSARADDSNSNNPIVPSSLSRSFGSASERVLAGFNPSAPMPVRPVKGPAGGASAPDTTQKPDVGTTQKPDVGATPLPSQMIKSAATNRHSTDWMRDDEVDASAANAVMHHEEQSFNLCAQMRCKVFLKQSYAQWRSLGLARLRLYHLMPSQTNQLVVENDKKVIISSIVLPIAVGRVGKTGVAVELSDMGRLTGIVYMLHMRSDESANGLFEQLLQGSSRSPVSSPSPK